MRRGRLMRQYGHMSGECSPGSSATLISNLNRHVHLQEPRWAPTAVPALAGAALLRAGQHHTLALTRAGAVLSAGRPTYGRLGRRGVDPALDDPLPIPGPVEGLDGVQVSGLAAGARQTTHRPAGQEQTTLSGCCGFSRVA